MTSVDAPQARRNSPADVVAGFLAVASIVLSLFAMLAWVVGMTIAVLTENPLI